MSATHHRPDRRHRQRGGASVVVSIAIFLALTLVVGYTGRHVLLEHHLSVNHWHATRSAETAAAGLEWTLAMLNNPSPIGSDCLPSDTLATRSFRDRLLNYDAALRQHLPATRLAGTQRVVLDVACRHVGDRWACHCPIDGPARPPAAGDEDPHPGFIAHLEPAGPDGSVRLAVTGCASAANACDARGGDAHSPPAAAHVDVALFPGLVARPPAPLMARGSIDTGGSAVVLQNGDASSGAAVAVAGGRAHLPNARIRTAPGASGALAVRAGVSALADADATAWFVRHFGVPPVEWARQPAVKPVDCGSDCSAALPTAIADGAAGDNATSPILWVDGDLALSGPLQLGTPARPVVIVVRGQARLDGGIAIHGVLHADAIVWRGIPPEGAQVDGALLSAGDLQIDGPLAVRYDRRLLEHLQHRSGSFVRVPGSWSDQQP